MAGQPSPTSPIPQTQLDGGGGRGRQMVPFRVATIERSEILPSESGTITVGQQPIERTTEGTGFLYAIVLDFNATTAANAAATTFAEDGPYTSLPSVVLRDPSGELVNLGGYNLYLANLADAQYANRFWDQSALNTLTTGAGATGGTFVFLIRVPVGLNRRSLLGLLGNQDRSIKYQLRTDIGASGTIYGTPPTTLPPFTLQKLYESYAVPPAMGPGGPQAIVPDRFGTLHFHTQSLSEAVPLGGSTVNHYVRRIGNTVRYFILVFRSNGLRATADANAPSRIQLKVGDTDVFNETYRYRRALMYERYGFDMPAGVLVYETLHDFSPRAGFEMGDDWWSTQAVNSAQFLITYPAGFGSTNNSLNIVTSDIALVGQPLGS